ncbi:MAG: hypothetical protein ACE5GW_01395, partial [Planctomycetota bacterium]
MERGSAGGVIICGLGPIGREVGRLTAYAPGIAAVVDLDPAAVEAFFEEVKAPAPTFSSLRDALEAAPGARVFLCTRSSFLEIAPDLRAAARVGSSVITSCEEAAWPFARYP